MVIFSKNINCEGLLEIAISELYDEIIPYMELQCSPYSNPIIVKNQIIQMICSKDFPLKEAYNISKRLPQLKPTGILNKVISIEEIKQEKVDLEVLKQEVSFLTGRLYTKNVNSRTLLKELKVFLGVKEIEPISDLDNREEDAFESWLESMRI